MREWLKRHDWKSCRGNTLGGSNPPPSAIFPFLLLGALAVLAFINAVPARDFIRDDRYVIAENPLLRSWSSLPKLLSTGYWEGPMGSEAPVQEYRPALMLSYFLTARAAGMSPTAFLAGNIALHAINTLLVFLILRGRLGSGTALLAGALFAVLPVHVESVVYISGRSELLVAFFLLLCWFALDGDHPRSAVACFLGALLSKEQAVLFPLVLVMDDWAMDRRFDARALTRRYAPFAVATLAYLGLRAAVLSRSFHGGQDYFAGASYGVRLMTMSRFAWQHYALPAFTGLGLQSEFVRPFFRDSSLTDPTGWAAVAGWLVVIAAALYAFFRRRASWGFWTASSLLWLLPVSNLVIKLDTIGAERFLYLPSVGVCALIAMLIAALRPPKLSAAASAVAVCWFALIGAKRNRVWASQLSYYERAVQDNPLSSRAQSGLGAAFIETGRPKEAEAAFERSLDLDTRNVTAYYNLGRLRFESGDDPAAERFLREALRLDPSSADARVLLALVLDRRGHAGEAEMELRKALQVQPWSLSAHFNLGRLLAAKGHPAEASVEFEEFLRLAPNDPEAPAVRRWLSEATGRSSRSGSDRKN